MGLINFYFSYLEKQKELPSRTYLDEILNKIILIQEKI